MKGISYERKKKESLRNRRTLVSTLKDCTSQEKRFFRWLVEREKRTY